MRRRKSIVGDEENPPDLILISVASDDEGSSSLSQHAVRTTKTSGSSHEDVNDEATTFVSNPGSPRWYDAELDKFLGAYCSFFYGAYVADLGLKLLQWTAWAVSYLAQKSRFAAISPGMHQLYYEVSMTRYVLRFYGFLQSLEGYRSGSWAGSGWDDPLIDIVARYAMAGSMLFYYPLEHVSYAGWRLPELVSVNAHLFSIASCSFWALYIVGDVSICILKLKELKKKLGELNKGLNEKKRNDDKEAVASLLSEEQRLLDEYPYIKLELLRCALWILPAIHWSQPNYPTKPLLGELPLNGLMLAEAYAHLYQSLDW